jgi:hypothetical protein
MRNIQNKSSTGHYIFAAVLCCVTVFVGVVSVPEASHAIRNDFGNQSINGRTQNVYQSSQTQGPSVRPVSTSNSRNNTSAVGHGRSDDDNGSSCRASYVSCTGSPSALCGDVNTGTRNVCGGSCSAPPFPDTQCRNKPLGEPALVITPVIVRIGNTVDITWDTGTNHPTNCSLTGSGIPSGFTVTTRTGTVETEAVTGPHRYTLSCGVPSQANSSVDLRVLPVIFES